MCGIFGIINPTVKPFKKDMFNVLGINNDTRGGDSCGIFIDGKTEYGIDDNALYIKFQKKSKLLKHTTQCRIALGHDRKASIGAINLKTAQPVVIKNKHGKIEYVVIHNGTIYNYLDLAEKYIPDVNVTGMTDSQVMAHIMYHCGYDVLGEYIGGAVFVIVDYRNGSPTTYMWKGASAKSSYYKEVEEERPLFFTNIDDATVFSSIQTYLHVWAGKEGVFTLAPNMLCKITKKGPVCSEEISRSNCYQSGTGYTDGKKNKPIQLQENYPDYYSDYYSNSEYFYTYYNNTQWETQDKKDKTISIDKSINYYVMTDRYYCGAELCHGEYSVNMFGYCNNNDKEKKVWFWQGVILYNKECFDFLTELMNKRKFAIAQFTIIYKNLVHYLCPYPSKPNHVLDDLMVKYITEDTSLPFTGSLQKIFHNYIYEYASGKQQLGNKLKTFSEIFNSFPPECNLDLSALKQKYIV